MKKYLFNLTALLLICITGCKKNTNSPTASVKLISQAIHTSGGNGDVTVYKYDDQNHLIEMSNSVLNQDYKFYYDSSDRLIEQDYTATNLSEKETYIYSNATTIIETDNNQYNGTTTSSINTYTLNSQQQPTSLMIGTDGNLITKFTYDSNNNLSTRSDYLNKSTSSGNRITDLYDQNKSPFFNVKGNLLILLEFSGIHNIVMETAEDFTHVNGTTYYLKNTYEYDSDQFPTKSTIVETSSTNMAPITNTYTYTYITK